VYFTEIYRVAIVTFAILETALITAVVATWDTLNGEHIWGSMYETTGHILSYHILVFGSLLLIPITMAIEEMLDYYFGI
jgi:hypothetical protein